eukprot:CAMPEP_0172834742 /NCGR_PEP_ID=MMETSP1075-20121228/25276_1 /TAXON_ID=2916 /ORGANISM="Ceratium fusus, Strain PA161109" /LENGTH=57 /DNA_ID=CAMNT_0013677685 /DNA_START=260 /DNA_END=433 /DNA_ORIENTATION=+
MSSAMWQGSCAWALPGIRPQFRCQTKLQHVQQAVGLGWFMRHALANHSQTTLMESPE